MNYSIQLERNNCTTLSYSRSTPDCGPTRPGAWSSGMLRVVDDEDLGQTILEIAVRGKRGVGYCNSMPGAVRPFERLRSRLRPARIYGVNTPEKSSVTMPAIGTSASGTNIWDGPNKPLSRFGVA